MSKAEPYYFLSKTKPLHLCISQGYSCKGEKKKKGDGPEESLCFVMLTLHWEHLYRASHQRIASVMAIYG